jgi:hypothetical protein
MVSTQTKDKSMAMFRSWLKYRPVLIFRLSSPSSQAQPKHGKAWNALLAAEYLSKSQKDSQPGARTKAREELCLEMLSFLSNNVGGDSDVQFAGDIDPSTEGCAWHGIPFEDLRPEHFEQILWELSEVNFRFEFQALDCRARRGTAYEHDTNSDTALMACVPDGSFVAPSLSIANHGIASGSPRERAHYLFAMARVMSKWKWTTSEGWIKKTGQLQWSANELEELEKEIASVYTQSFYDCFRRAAILPRRLTEAAMKARPQVGQEHQPQMAPYLENRPTIIINLQSAISSTKSD